MSKNSSATIYVLGARNDAPGKDLAHPKEILCTDLEHGMKKYPDDKDENEKPSVSNVDRNQNAFTNSREMPREVDLFSEENVEEILETMDSLRASVEQLQMHCEKLASEKSKFEQALIDKEREHHVTNERFQGEMSYLRKVNLQLVQQSQNTSAHNNGDLSAWLKDALDAEMLHKEKTDAVAKTESLRLAVMEKDKIISNLEWQVMDCETTITSLQAERDKIAFELDYNLAREQDELEMLGVVGENFEDPFMYDPNDRRSASYVEAPQHLRKPPQRHYSNLTNRDSSKTEAFEGASYSSWLDDQHSGNDFGSGRLKRSTNFSNINDLDESENYDDDNHSMLSGYASETDRALELPESTPLSKLSKNKWQSFGSDSGEWQDANRVHSPVVQVNSDMSELCVWQAVCDSKEQPQPQLVKDISKKDGSSPCVQYIGSTDDSQSDLWSFTPDSILNVTTGEEISHPDPPQTIEGRFEEMCSPVDRENQKSEIHVELEQTHGKGGVGESSSLESAEAAADTAKRKHPAVCPKQPHRILEEYQKWKVTGRKGDPPAKLKISQC